MSLISDILMIAGALGVAFYCVVLSRRLTRFTDLEKGVGGAIAVLSAQVDDMTRTLEAAQAQAAVSGQTLVQMTTRAEDVARRLELHLAALHDIDAPGSTPAAPRPGPGEPAHPVAFRRKEPAIAQPEVSRSVTPPPPPPRNGSAPVQSFFSSHRHSAIEATE